MLGFTESSRGYISRLVLWARSVGGPSHPPCVSPFPGPFFRIAYDLVLGFVIDDEADGPAPVGAVHVLVEKATGGVKIEIMAPLGVRTFPSTTLLAIDSHVGRHLLRHLKSEAGGDGKKVSHQGKDGTVLFQAAA